MKILIIEDDPMVGTGLSDLLGLYGYEVCLADSIEAFRKVWPAVCPDLIILDIWLPDGSGIDLCRKIREESNLPILFLTACEGESVAVEGLRAGGDDYVIKPFRPMELVARIEALKRRTSSGRGGRTAVSGQETAWIAAGSLRMDPETQRVYIHDTEIQVLRPTDKLLLYALLKAQGNTVSRDSLQELLWREGADYVEGNTLNVCISRLRKNLADAGCTEVIETCRGIGYRLKVN